MNPRRYRAPRRQEAAAATRRRIVEAVVRLHAERGVTATTYAMIAKRADVAIPTVYNHFPTTGELLAACTSHVAAGAPSLGSEIFAEASDLEGRIHILARALCVQYRYRAPWLRWAVHEAVLVPEIGAILDRAKEGRRQLILSALEPGFGPRPPEPLVALSEILFDFTSWQRLARDKSASNEKVEMILAEALLVLAREYLSVVGRTPAAGRSGLRPGRQKR